MSGAPQARNPGDAVSLTLPAVLRLGGERLREVVRRHGGGIWREAILLTLVLGLALTLNLSRVGAYSISGDEGLYAFPAREAAVHGNWYPLLSGQGGLFHSKPPLEIWPVALSFYLAGVSEWADRLPSAIAGAALVGVVYLFSSWLMGPGAGLLAAALLATCPPWLFRHGAREGVGDPLLCLLLTVALLLYLRYRSTGRLAWLAGACAAAALGGLVKGAIGPAILLAVTAVWEILRPHPRAAVGLTEEASAERAGSKAGSAARGGDPPPPAAAVRVPVWREVAVRLAAPVALGGVGMTLYLLWLLDTNRRGVDVAAFLYWDIYLRVTHGLAPEHVNGAGFYPEVLGRAFGYWWLAVLPAAVWLWRGWPQDGPRARAILLVALWPVIVMGILSVSVSKLDWYVDPALPPIAILLAAGCAEIGRLFGHWRIAALAFTVLVAILVGLRAQSAWRTLERPMQLSQMHQFVLKFGQLPAARLYLDHFNPAGGQLQPWDSFYMAELDGASYPLPPDLRTIPGCAFVISASPAEAAARLGAEQWYAAPIEKRLPEVMPLYLIDFCDGRVGRDLGWPLGSASASVIKGG